MFCGFMSCPRSNLLAAQVPNPEFLKNHCVENVRGLDQNRRNKLVLFLIDERGASTDPDHPAEVPFCTCCGGSEIYLSVLVFYEQAFRDELGVYVKFRQRFGCEVDLDKAKCSEENDILGEGPALKMFQDIHESARSQICI